VVDAFAALGEEARANFHVMGPDGDMEPVSEGGSDGCLGRAVRDTGPEGGWG
jgi:hypothetical protein